MCAAKTLKLTIMTTTTENKITDFHMTEFYATICPFGYMDVSAAIRVALDAGERAEYAAEQVNDYMEQTVAKLTDVDPVYCVLESILQHARGEIDTLTGYDFINDNTTSEIYTYGNFMCSSYDYTENAIKELKSKLKKAKVSKSDFDNKTNYFLSEIGITLK